MLPFIFFSSDSSIFILRKKKKGVHVKSLKISSHIEFDNFFVRFTGVMVIAVFDGIIFEKKNFSRGYTSVSTKGV